MHKRVSPAAAETSAAGLTSARQTMDTRRHRLVGIFLLFLAVLATGIALKELVAPGLARRRLVSAVKENCGTCELSLGRGQLSLLPLALRCSKVRFTQGTPNATVVHAEAERVYLPFSLFPLFKSRLRLGSIRISESQVTVTEGDLYAASPAKDSPARPLDLEIEGLEVRNSSFTYIREHSGRKGSLAVTRINAAVGPVGVSDRLRDKDVEASADGLLEHSGQFSLQVRARLFAKAPDLDVKLRIAGQELAALNAFFKPNDAVQLKGQLIEGRSTVAIRGARLKASSYVRYKGLEVRIKKSGERGGISAFFQTFLASVTMGKQNAAGDGYDRTGSVELERKPKETIISFTLRGMKEGALKVSSQAR